MCLYKRAGKSCPLILMSWALSTWDGAPSCPSRGSCKSQAFWGHDHVSSFCIISGAQDWTVTDAHLEAAGRNRERWSCHKPKIKGKWNPVRVLGPFFIVTFSRSVIALQCCVGLCCRTTQVSCLALSPWITSDSATPRTVARQAPLSTGFSRQEHWRELPCPPPGHLPSPGIEPRCPAVQAGSLPFEPPVKPQWISVQVSPPSWAFLPPSRPSVSSQRALILGGPPRGSGVGGSSLNVGRQWSSPSPWIFDEPPSSSSLFPAAPWWPNTQPWVPSCLPCPVSYLGVVSEGPQRIAEWKVEASLARAILPFSGS